MPTLIPFPTINHISVSVKRANSTSVFFKTADHAYPGADIK